jgi:hypothetical protein
MGISRKKAAGLGVFKTPTALFTKPLYGYRISATAIQGGTAETANYFSGYGRFESTKFGAYTPGLSNLELRAPGGVVRAGASAKIKTPV